MGNTDTSNNGGTGNGGDGTNAGPGNGNAGPGGGTQPPGDGGNAGTQQTPQNNDNPAGADQLGDAGKRALDAMKGERNQARKELADVQERLKKFEDAQKSAEQKAEEAAAAAEKRAREALDRIASAEAQAALVGVVADPKAFVEDLNLSKYVDYDKGEVDSDAIAKLKDKYAGFAPQGQKPAGMQPNPAQGANGSKPNQSAGQLTKEQLKGMTPAQIVKAQNDGQLTDLLGTKK